MGEDGLTLVRMVRKELGERSNGKADRKSNPVDTIYIDKIEIYSFQLFILYNLKYLCTNGNAPFNF